MRKYCACLLCLLLLPHLAGAQTLVGDKLSNPRVRCFEQDLKGRMWIGTARGLNRYNGYDYHHFLSPEIPGNEINDILCDSRGRIWVATESGIAVWEESKGFTSFDTGSRITDVRQVLEDRDGRIFINLTEDLCVLDTLRGCFVKAVPLFDRLFQYHQKCYIGPDARLWVVGAAEIRCFDTSTMRNTDNFITPSSAIFSCLFDSGRILFGSRRSLYSYDTTTGRCDPLDAGFLKEDIEFINPLGGKRALIKTVGGDLFLYDDLLRSAASFELQTRGRFNLTLVKTDAEGNIWAGSSNDGFSIIWADKGRFNPDRSLYDTFANIPVTALASDSRGLVWAMSDDGRIILYDPSERSGREVEFEGIAGQGEIDMLQSNPGTLFVDSSDRIWIAWPNQRKVYLCEYDGRKLVCRKNFTTYYPHCFIQNEDGDVWLGQRSEQLLRFRSGDMSMIQAQPWNNSEVRSILPLGGRILVAAYNDPLIWVNASTGGASSIDLSEGDLREVSTNNIFSPSCMLSVASEVWIGTRNSGILLYDIASGTVRRAQNLPFSSVCAMLPDSGGNVWVSTPEGLCRVEAATMKTTMFGASQEAGEWYNEGAACMTRDGHLLFGGSHGVTQVDCSWTEEQKNSAFIFEDIVFADGSSIDVSGLGSVRLEHSENSFSISFEKVDIRQGANVSYECRLRGYENEWMDLGHRRQVFYSNLSPGHYVFQVRCGGSEEAELHIRLKPSFAGSWWMICLYVLVAAFAACMVLRARKRLAEEKDEARKAREAGEMEKRQSDMNMRFFANISHEFRTPLTMISGPAEQLSQDEALSEEQKGMVRMMQRSINRMLSLVNQLLDMGKLENDTLRLQVFQTDLVPELRLICEPFRLDMRSHGIRLELEHPKGPVISMVDTDKLQKILSNLLSNAEKFTPEGGLVTVRLRIQEKDVCISVADTGPGIPEDKLEKVFDRYYQLDKGRKGKVNYGTGIGLYYARALAGVHHGSLAASNSGQGGAVFTLRFPWDSESYSEEEILRTVAPDGPLETVPGLVGPQEETAPDSRPCVLVVDDDKDLLQYMTSLLSSRYRVLSLDNSENVPEVAREQSPDLILSDVMMPGKSGLELCREIKDDIQLSHIPFILVTAKGAVDSQVEGLEQGADAYVTKPFSPSYLLALVKSQLDRSQRIRSALNKATEAPEVSTDGLSAKDSLFLRELYSKMNEALSDESFDISEFAEQMGVSRSKFFYKIKSLTGKTPGEFLMQYRLNIAAKMLKEGDKNVSEVAYAIGFSTLSHFSKTFKKQFGVSPSHYA